MALPSINEVEYELSHSREDRGKDILSSFVVCVCLATIAVILRLVARRVSKAALKADDYWILISLVSPWVMLCSFSPPRLWDNVAWWLTPRQANAFVECSMGTWGKPAKSI